MTAYSLRDGVMVLTESAFRLDITDRAMLLRQLSFFERVSAGIPIKQWRLPHGLDKLPAACDALLKDLFAA